MADLRKDTLLFCREYTRMCDSFGGCEGCPCGGFGGCSPTAEPENAAMIVDAVQQWSDEHPRKTYAEDLLGKFPKAVNNDGYPAFCRDNIYGIKRECNHDCEACWTEVMPEDTE